MTPASALTFVILWLAIEYVIAGPYSVLYAGDNSEIILPGLLRGRFFETLFSSWDRFAGAGSDRESLGFIAPIDVVLFGTLPGWLAYGLRCVTQAGVAVIGAYALARRTFHFSPWTALFCAAAYGLLYQHAMMIDASMDYQVGLVAALSYLLDGKRDPKRWLLFAGALLLSAWTGYFSRLVPFTSAFIVAWFLFVEPRWRWRDWTFILSTALAVVLLRADTIWALAIQAPLSQLSLMRNQATLNEAFHYLLVHPFLEGPVTAACTALFAYGIVVNGVAAPRVRAMLVLLALGATAPFAAVAGQLWSMQALPWLYGYNFLRFTFIPASMLPFAAGFGIRALAEQFGPAGWRRPGVARLACLAATLVLGYASFERKWIGASEWLTQGTFAQNYQSPQLRDLASRIRDLNLPVRAETVQMYSSYLNAYGIETASAYQPVYQRRYYDFWAKIFEPGMATPAPYRGDKLMLIPDDHRPERRLADLYRMNLLSLANVAFFISRDRLTDETLEPLHEAERPWSLLSTREKIMQNARENFTGRTNLYVYRNKQTIPRIFSVGDLRVFESSEAVLNAMAISTTEELRSTAFVAAQDMPTDLHDTTSFAPLSFHLERYGTDELEISYDAPGKGLIVVTNSFSPYWRCAAGGVNLGPFPADHAFWGIPLDRGTGTVVCLYRPPSLW